MIDKTGLLKIADFGLARAFSIPLPVYTHEVVTLWYRAPEVLLGQKQYSIPIDVWSIGCIFAEMITKRPLFPGDSEIDQLYKIFQLLGTPNNEVWNNVTELPEFRPTFPKWRAKPLESVLSQEGKLLVDREGIDLLQQMLYYEPSKRVSARKALDHPYFNSIEKSLYHQFQN